MMMKSIVFLTVSLSLFMASCRSTFTPEVESLLSEMHQKVDPGKKLKTLMSQEVRGNFRRSSADRGATMTIRAARPDKIRTDIVIPGDVSIVRAFDGEKAWEYTTKSGYRALEGHELSKLRFHAMTMLDLRLPDKLSSSIKIDGEGVVMGVNCIRLVCTPPRDMGDRPFTLFIDKDTLLLKKRVEDHGSPESGFFTMSTVFDDYRDFDGILMPCTMISQVHDQMMEFDVTSVSWNENFHHSTFAPPEKLK
ncbi:MAG: hypothetical protein JW808_02830 [Victivallales bacterium]|nr:hypothetical protein [Victivallales bacterium]